jgi:trehalose 6-phosphate phosphatase
MKYLFSNEGTAALAAVVQRPALFAFDFDGTLAPIEPRPESVRTPTSIVRLLDALARERPVAVISGRRRSDLTQRLPPSVRYLVGNHGNEGFARDEERILHATCRAWLEQLDALFAGDARAAEVAVEDKGMTLSLHYRLARDREAAGDWLREVIAQVEPAPTIIGGKLVFNLLPPGALTKFEALQALAHAEAVETVLFVGDDDTDELVFERAPANWLTVRVELERNSRARYFLQQQADVAQLLDWLVHHRMPLGAAARR